MAAYEDTVVSLHRAPFADFVAERKRLAAELKAGGDKEGAARLAKLPRPPISAWAVNQLWWKERRGFERLIAVAARIKAGEREAGKAHREQLAQLRDQAAELLREAGNAANEPTLRRVATTLSAIAAQGDFAPDAPGTLSADRDPPGFETLGFGGGSPREAASPPQEKEERTTTTASRHAEAEQRRREEAEQRRQEAERRRAEEEERKRRAAERERLSTALREARAHEAAQRREQARLEQELESVEQSLHESKALLERLESELASL